MIAARQNYLRGLWLALMNARGSQDRAILQGELNRLNAAEPEPEGEGPMVLQWAGDVVMCQASAFAGSDRPCSQRARWCLTLGQLQHFHVCGEHGLRMLQDARPFFSVRSLEDCPQQERPTLPPPGGTRSW